ncbi:hypothetical protein N7588_17490, partial [Acinetobacter sp. GD04021]|uniref:hypothetical protein n=1 Tax=Acinetobacter sp. GD04021 TaxID=2975421 RepID=UPI002446B044
MHKAGPYKRYGAFEQHSLSLPLKPVFKVRDELIQKESSIKDIANDNYFYYQFKKIRINLVHC